MSYTPTIWSTGDVITAEKLNNIETGIENVNHDNEEFLNDLYNVYPTVTKTGNSISFDDGANNIPVLSLNVDVSFEQTGSGEPSIENVRLFTGKNSVSVKYSGEDTSDYSTVDVQISDADGTVYGGSIDVISGVLTVTHKFIEFNGEENWTIAYKDGLPAFSLNLDYNGNAVNNSGTFSHFMYGQIISSSGYGAKVYNINGITRLIIRFENQPENVESFKSLLASWSSINTPLQCVYPYATPIVYHLTPHEIRTLLGVNNMWTDDGTLTVKYRADIGLLIQEG